MDSPNFSNPQQERIYDRLRSLVGPGAAAFWCDACRLMEMEPPLESTTHLVGHLLREIESSLRDVLEPLAKPPAKPHKCKHCGHQLENKCPNCNLQLEEEKPTHKDEIRSILDELKIPQSDVAKSWLKLANRNDDYGLHRRAHRKDLAPPRPADQKFRQFWSEIQDIFDIALDRFETLYSKVCRLLDELLKKSTPTKDDIKQLRLNIPNSFVALSYFFERLHSSEWLMPLQKKHFFEDPPDSDLPWPQSRYLVRMASQKPAIVLEIAQEILKTGTKNTSVHQDLAEAALVMPPKLAADWVKEETKWIKEQDNLYFSLPEKLGKLIVYLAESEQVDAALGLARELLAVMPNPEENSFTRVRTRYDEDYYGQILTEYIPKLLEVAQEDTLKVLCELLDNAVRLSQSQEEDDSSEDGSRSWRPAIEEHHKNFSHGVRNLLVNVVRDITEKIAKNELTKVRGLVQTIESYNWRIFQRMALHLLRKFPDAAPDLVVERLTDHQRFSDSDLKEDYEYVVLLKERFAYLAPEEQQKILTWIAEGFDLNKLSLRNQEERELHLKRWQRNKLTPIREYLSSEWQKRYEDLVDELGKPKFRELVFDSYSLDQEDYSSLKTHSEWSWAGEVVVDLLKVGLEVRGKNEIPFHLRNEFWEVLRLLLTDHSKSILCYKDYSSSKLVNRSFNIVSSAAMHTVIHYAFWVRQQAVQNFDEMPEVREILESHLAPNKDSSPVIQAVYGYRFQSLVTLDLDWTTQNMERIFPKDESLRELRDAAWEGYITKHSADAQLFNILREEYSHAIEQIGTSTHEWQNPRQSDERLAEHLMQFYWNRVLNLGESDSLLERFFAKAPEQHRQYFMKRIGRLVFDNQSKIEPEFLVRLQQFWEWRISVANSSPSADLYASELKTFGRWFSSGKFDNNWAIAQLKEVLRLAKDVNDDSILRHIADLASSKPLDAFECFRLIADGTRDLIRVNQESSRIILSTALQHEDEEIRKAAKELINRLLVRGIDFRDLRPDGEV